MERLRADDGCPWDRAQTFASIAPFTIEESYEVADAIERGDMPHLKDELGDLLFQVVFHAQLAREAGHFDFEDVAGAICGKLTRRHPHVFGPTPSNSTAGFRSTPRGADAAPMSVEVQSAAWEDIKAAERASRAGERASTAGEPASATTSALDGVPLALPALMRAFKLSKRAARVGFDFEHAAQTADKVAEELAEVREALADAAAAPAAAQVFAAIAAPADVNAGAAPAAATHGGGVPVATTHAGGASPEIVEEIGDLLFAAANLARKLNVDAEAALRAANIKFERRFHGMERLAAERGVRFDRLNLAAQEALWQEVKRAE